MPRGRVSQTAVDRFECGFAPDQGVEPAMPVFHPGGRGVVCTQHRASNSESVKRIERPGAVEQAPILVSGPIAEPGQGRNTE
jgi:hypothetical protein